MPDNVGRTVIEIYSGAEFVARAVQNPLTGGGVAALEEAHRSGRPVILVTGHFGNYDASRAALIARGYRVGALYMPMANRYFNEHYVKAISGIGSPLFPRGRSGLAAWCGICGLAGCWGCWSTSTCAMASELTFFGRQALTALSAAELALKYDALLVPTYAVRQADGLSFDIIVEPPIPHWHARSDDAGAERQSGGAGAPASGPVVLDSPPLEGKGASPALGLRLPVRGQSTRAAARIAGRSCGLQDHRAGFGPAEGGRHLQRLRRPPTRPDASHEVTMLW